MRPCAAVRTGLTHVPTPEEANKTAYDRGFKDGVEVMRKAAQENTCLKERPLGADSYAAVSGITAGILDGRVAGWDQYCRPLVGG